MDQKFRTGDPFDGKPMKRFGEDDDAVALPAPPSIEDVVEKAKEVLNDNTPQKWKGKLCPCGKRFNECKGLGGFMTKEETFAMLDALGGLTDAE